MSFFTIFKSRKPRRFNMPTRYYDPVKDDLHQRIAAKRKEMGMSPEQKEDHVSRLSAAFQERRRVNAQASGLQMIFAILFALIFVMYFYYGEMAFIAFIFIAPVYFIFKKLKKV